MKRALEAALHGRYEVLEEIGAGGFGTVFKGRQVTTGQLIAVKVLQDSGLSPTARQKRVARFRREMVLCGRLHHPHIVPLIDSGTTPEGSLYSVFELVPGKNLQQVIEDEGWLSPQETKHLLGQVLDALACAHSQGIVHRDLKPANLMVVPSGARRNALVLDFGISAVADGPSIAEFARITATNEALGTPLYAAPEQLKGDPLTPRSDLYAWGLVFLECLSGQAAMGPGSVAAVLLRQIMLEPVPLLAELREHPLGDLLARALVKDPDRRTSSATDLLLEREALDLSDLQIVHNVLARGDGTAATVVMKGTTKEVTMDGTGAEVRPLPSTMRVRRAPATAGAGTSPAPDGRLPHAAAMCCTIALNPAVIGADMEDVDDAVRAMQSICAETAERFGGELAGALGEQILFQFVELVASRDETERASSAAIEIARAGLRHAAGTPPLIGVRIGIHAGDAPPQESGRARPSPARFHGMTPRIAGALSAAARPGTIVVSAEARARLEASVALRDHGWLDVGGLGPLPMFELIVG